jgi:sarcosine oxidase subunit beta
MLTKADVVVVGGGAIGSAVAFYAAKDGASVVLLERHAVGAGSSSANPGAVSMATKKPGIALKLAQASQRLYETLNETLQADVEYEVSGTLIVCETEFELEFCSELAAGQEAAGVQIEVIGPDACRTINPLVEGPILGGVYCPTDAHINPFLVTQSFARAAANAGTVVMTGAVCEGVTVENGRVVSVQTNLGTIETTWLINAAGAFSPEIGTMVGTKHEVVPRRGQIMVVEGRPGLPRTKLSSAKQLVAKHLAKPGVAEDRLSLACGYTLKPRSGTVLLGSTNEFVGFDTSSSIEAMHGITEYAARLMPSLEGLHVLRSWAGLRPYSPSGPIIGRAGGPDGYVAATGHGGDGVALAPITGTLVAEMLRRDDADLNVEKVVDEVAVRGRA